jgi:hypothetical protein
MSEVTDLNSIIAKILEQPAAQPVTGGEISGGRKLPAKLRKWNYALQAARRELGVVGFLAPKKHAGARSPQRRLYEAAKHFYDHGRSRRSPRR